MVNDFQQAETETELCQAHISFLLSMKASRIWEHARAAQRVNFDSKEFSKGFFTGKIKQKGLSKEFFYWRNTNKGIFEGIFYWRNTNKGIFEWNFFIEIKTNSILCPPLQYTPPPRRL